MATATYQERLNAERTEKVRSMLRDLPSSCTDFINSITMTTSLLSYHHIIAIHDTGANHAFAAYGQDIMVARAKHCLGQGDIILNVFGRQNWRTGGYPPNDGHVDHLAAVHLMIHGYGKGSRLHGIAV